MRVGIVIQHLSEITILDHLWVHDFVIVRDQIHQHAWETTIENYHDILKSWIDTLKDCDIVIAPPISELMHGTYPLFRDYLKTIQNHSIVGKLWFIGDHVWCQYINSYRPTHTHPTFSDHQLSNRHFHAQRPIRSSDTHHRHHRLDDYSPRSWMINNLVKYSLHGLKDAGVDTLVPLDRSYLLLATTITHHRGKMRFHKLAIDIWQPSSLSTITFRIIWSDHLLRMPKRRWYLKKYKILT